jgi:hypothetical protein
MARGSWVGEAVYSTGERFTAECLRTDGSLFTPGVPIWGSKPVEDFYARFVLEEKTEGGNFLERLEQQLAGAPDATIQLAAESIFFNYLCEGDTGAEHKRKVVSRVLSFMQHPASIPPELDTTFSSGIARIGQAKTQKWQNVAFLLEFARGWKTLSQNEQQRLLGDHAAFRAFVRSLEKHSASVQIEGLLHLIFPDEYETIVSPNVKRRVVQAFADFVDGAESDIDEQLASIRRNLLDDYGENFSFYDAELIAQWGGSEPGVPAWLVRGARAYGTNLIPRWLAEGFVSISDPAEPQFEPGANLNEIIDLLQAYQPEKTRQQLRNNALTGRRFVSQMAKGDLVLTIDPEDRIYVGRVTGDLEWVADDEPGTARRRTVDWLNSQQPPHRRDLPDALTRLFRQNTVIDLSSASDAVTELIPEVDAGAWDGLLHWAKRIYEVSNFDEEERDYKFQAAANVQRAREAHDERDDDWTARLRRAFGPPNNLTSWRSHSELLTWADANPDLAAGFFDRVWTELPDEEQFGDLLATWPVQQSPGARINLLSYLLSGLDTNEFPIYRAGPAQKIRALVGLPREDTDDGRRYFSFIELLDELERRLFERGTTLRDRVDAQGIVYWLTVNDPPAEWDEEEQAAFRAWRGDKTTVVTEEAMIQLPSAALAEELLVTPGWLSEIVDLLNEKRQVIFYGPPGTGKTFVAQAIARHVESHGGSSELVQFHPAYSYEDFFEGYRPRLAATNGIEFELRPGPLRRIADQARENPEQPHVLIIDEINRGNIAKIFGELYFLLEYRDHGIRLQYSPEADFRLPDNLYVVGTMNTADRSIALVDSALRRRFYFVGFLPRQEPLQSVLKRWLERENHGHEAADYLQALNDALALATSGDEELAIGPSYFITRGAPPDLDRIWRHAIAPLLEERFYGVRSMEEIEREFSPGALLGASPADVA